MARFEREAKLLASLNHPNIAAIYGLEQAEGKRFIVMELVEGVTLAQRLIKGPLPLEDSLGICRQIAEGLEAAHEKGVIHRDLKPANVMITEGDKVKILDFGLAKALSDETQSVDSSQSPTLTEAMTRPGVILGTAAYMSPEQAKGKTVDKRADIWAFGCILYECLTGKRAFESETVTETLAAVLKGEPDWQRLPESTPPALRLVLRRCLEKDAMRRFHHVADMRILLEESRNFAPANEPAGRKRRRALGVLALTALALLLPVMFLLGTRHGAERTPAGLSLRFSLPPTEVSSSPERYLYPALSPDGRWIVFPRSFSGKLTLWIRNNESAMIRELPGTDGVLGLFWSPDSRQIAFFADQKLKRMGIDDASAVTICALPAGALGGNGIWNERGSIIFWAYPLSKLYRAEVSGGAPVELGIHSQASLMYVVHSFLPDGNHFLFSTTVSGSSGELYLGALDGSDPFRLLEGIEGACYSPSGYLLFVRQQRIFARLLNPKSLSFEGEAVPLAENANPYSVTVSANGILSYVKGPQIESQLVWVNRDGRESDKVGEASGSMVTFDLSSDGSSLVVGKRQPGGHHNLWITDLRRNSTTRLTLENADHTDPRWSPDGRQVMFKSTGESLMRLFRVSPQSQNPEQFFQYNGTVFGLDDWSPDGRQLLYHDGAKPALWAIPASGDPKPVLAARSLSGTLDQAQFSPDGRWIAYHTDESGRFEVKVVPFPPTGESWQISTAGGAQPTWRGDGRELYFLAPDGMLMAANIKAGKTFDWEEARPLFKAPINVGFSTEQYDPAPDGRRFLFLKKIEGAEAPAVTIITNWPALLKR